MRKRIALILVLFLSVHIIGLSAVAENEEAYIKIGDYYIEVIMLHQKLIDLGYFGLRAESPWSKASERALMILQENLDEEITGVVEEKDQLKAYLAVENAIGRNLLLGTNQGTTNYSISQNGFETELTSPDGIEVKVTILSKDEDAGWLTLFYNDGRAKEILSGEAGEQFTLSFEAKSNVDNYDIRASHKKQNAKENQIDFGQANIGSDWSTVTLTGSLTGIHDAEQGLYLNLRYNAAGTEISIRNLKLERGTVATEWIAAIED